MSLSDIVSCHLFSGHVRTLASPGVVLSSVEWHRALTLAFPVIVVITPGVESKLFASLDCFYSTWQTTKMITMINEIALEEYIFDIIFPHVFLVTC